MAALKYTCQMSQAYIKDLIVIDFEKLQIGFSWKCLRTNVFAEAGKHI